MSEFKDYVYAWNLRFPIDRWWREKHKIPFGSQAHRDVSLIDQFFELTEDRIYNELRKDKVKYVAGAQDWLKERKVSQEDIDEAFDNIILK